MAQQTPYYNVRMRVAAISVLLFSVNVYVCRELFRIEYSRHMGSIEAAFIGIARYARDNGTDLTWFPLWYNGIPYQNSYPPLLHWLVAAMSGLTGWSAALAYHATVAFFYCFGPVTLFWLCYRLSRSLGPSFFAGLVYSCLAPAALLIADVRRDLGGVMRPRRLQALVVYGEGPHVTGLALLALSVLMLDIALQKRRPIYYSLAALTFAATAITNWLAGAALAIVVVSYLLAGELPGFRRRMWGALLVAAIAFAVAAPLLPPSTIRTIQFNARITEGDYTQYAKGLPLHVATLAAALLLARYLLNRAGASRTLQLGAYFSMVTGAITMSWEYARIVFVPQPHRYHLEMEWGLAILAPFAIAPALRRAPAPARAALAVAFIVAAVPFAKSSRRYARYILEPADITQRVEYKTARWLDANFRDRRVMVPGSTSFWLNAFTDTPQLGGGFDQGATNFLVRVATYVLYSSDGTGDRDTQISVAWLKAFGVHAIATGGPRSGEYYKPFRNPRKFDGILPVLWRDGDDTLFRVPGRTESLAHAMIRADLPSRVPVNGIDIEPFARYVKALDDAGYPEASLRWTSRHSARIFADLKPGHIVSVQIAHHPGWRATVNGHRVPVSSDALGQMSVEPSCDGPCAIDLVYDGGAEMRAARALSWIAVTVCLAWIIVAAYFDVRKRVAPPGAFALF